MLVQVPPGLAAEYRRFPHQILISSIASLVDYILEVLDIELGRWNDDLHDGIAFRALLPLNFVFNSYSVCGSICFLVRRKGRALDELIVTWSRCSNVVVDGIIVVSIVTGEDECTCCATQVVIFTPNPY